MLNFNVRNLIVHHWRRFLRFESIIATSTPPAAGAIRPAPARAPRPRAQDNTRAAPGCHPIHRGVVQCAHEENRSRPSSFPRPPAQCCLAHRTRPCCPARLARPSSLPGAHPARGCVRGRAMMTQHHSVSGARSLFIVTGFKRRSRGNNTDTIFARTCPRVPACVRDRRIDAPHSRTQLSSLQRRRRRR